MPDKAFDELRSRIEILEERVRRLEATVQQWRPGFSRCFPRNKPLPGSRSPARSSAGVSLSSAARTCFVRSPRHGSSQHDRRDSGIVYALFWIFRRRPRR